MIRGRLLAPFAMCLSVCVAAAAGACSSSSRTVTPPTPSTTGATGATSATIQVRPPCAPGATYTPGTTRHTLRVAGLTREFLVHIPPHLAPRTMLIVDFHGATSSMTAQAVYSGFDSRADARGFVVATPNGTVIGGVRQWNFLGAPDLEFAVALVHELVAHACVDPHRAFATGISSGGAMTALLACRASDTFDGFAPVAADFYVPAACRRAQPRPSLIFHGTADPVVPYSGGRVATNNHQNVGGAEATAAQWAKHNGCGAVRTATKLGSEVVRLTWPHCIAPVVMYRIVGGGHTWPGATIAVAVLGHTTHQISASDEIVRLFSAQ